MTHVKIARGAISTGRYGQAMAEIETGAVSENRTKRKPRAANAPPAAGSGIRARSAAKNSDIVYRDLHKAIVTMELAPGAPVLERKLTEQYGVSRTPVREAVLRLVEDGLVEVAPKSGTFVARIPLSVVREALVARRALEEVTVRAATELSSESRIMQMRAIIQQQQEMADAGDEEAFHQADDAFHASIAAAARYPGIWKMIQQVRIQVERYRRLTLPQTGRMPMVVKEHTAVLDAMAAGDADAAVARMNEHLNKLQLDISIFRDLWPDYFTIDPVLDEKLFASR